MFIVNTPHLIILELNALLRTTSFLNGVDPSQYQIPEIHYNSGVSHHCHGHGDSIYFFGHNLDVSAIGKLYLDSHRDPSVMQRVMGSLCVVTITSDRVATLWKAID